MNPRTAWVVALAAGALVWSAAAELPLFARLLTAILLGPAPVAFMMQARVTALLTEPPPRMPIYLGSMIVLWALGVLAWMASAWSGFAKAEIGLFAIAPRAFVVWTLAVSIAAVAIVLAFRFAGMRETPIMHAILPVTPIEKVTFCGLSISAGLCEELAFRGFLMTAVTMASGSVAGGVVLSSLAFGILHAHQNVAGMARAALLGAVLCIPFLVTGSIYPSMTAHALIDIAGGLWLGKWMFE